MMIKESFDEAKQFFQNFLSEQGLSSDLLWVFGEDIICLPKRFLIKVPLPAENESFAEVCYNIGRERDFGQYSLMGNHSVKYSVRTDLINAEAVANPLLWQTYRLIEKFLDTRFLTLDKLPFRKAQLQTT